MSLADDDLIRALVAIPSVTGSEAEAVQFLQEQARRDGLRVIPDEAGNFVAEAGEGPRLLLVVGHIDTVPGHIPVRVEDGILWGRGAVDAKGPLGAAYCMARHFVGSKEVRVRVVGAVDEEGNSRGAKALPLEPRPDWIVIGEPSGAQGLTIAYKGIVRGAFHVERPRHHGAHPGLTAVEEAIAFWTAIGVNFADRFDAVQGHLTSIETQGDGLTDRVTARFNLRLPPGVEPPQTVASLQEAGSVARVRVEVDETVPPAMASKRSDLVAAFLTAIRGEGGSPRLLHKTGTCDFNLMARRYPGTPIVAYGPGDSHLDHTPEERLDLGEFAQAVSTLIQVATTLAQRP